MKNKKLISGVLAFIMCMSSVSLTESVIANADDTETTAVNITFNGDSISADSDVVTIDSTTVKITSGGVYNFTGAMTTDSQILVETADTDTTAVEINLDGVTMTNSTDTPCILVSNADKTKVTFTNKNVLTNTYDSSNVVNSVILAKDDLTFTKNSTGSLDIISDAENGIECNNDLKFNAGEINITTDNDGTETIKADAIKSKDTITISGGTINIDAAGDGIKTTSKGTTVTISDGTVSIKAGNDAIQATTDLAISDGTVIASGDNGLTSDGTLTITGGNVVATATEGQPTYTSYAGTQKAIEFNFAEEHKKSETISLDAVPILCDINKSFEANKASESVNLDDSKNALKKFNYLFISNSEIQAGNQFSLKLGDVQETIGGTTSTFTIGSDSVTLFENIMASTATETDVTTNTSNLGDVNADSKIDAKDAVQILKYYAATLAKQSATIDINSADINGDTKVDSKDAVKILRYYAANLAKTFTGSIADFK